MMSKKVKVPGSPSSPDIIEHKRGEETLRELEENYQRLFELLPIGVTILDMKGVILYCNSAVYNEGGYTEGEFTGKHFSTIASVRVKDIPTYIRVFNSIVRRKIPKPFETIYQRKDGTTGWAELHISLTKVGGKRRILVIQHDITERKRMEKQLRESEENFHRSLDDSPLGVRIFSSEGEMLYANQAILDIYGCASIEEFKITPVEKRLAPESYAEHLIRREKRLRGEGISTQFEMSIVRKDGEIRYLQVVRKEVLWNGERQVQSLYQDITERKRMEKQLRESEEKYKALFEELNDAAFLADVETGRILDTNKQGEVLLGRTREEIIGMHQSELHPPEIANNYRQRFATHVQKGHAADFDGEAVRKNGSIVSVSISASPVHIGGEELILGLFRDITERKRTEEALRESVASYKELADSIADVFFAMDKDLRYTYWNKASEELTGISAKDALGKHLYDLFPDNEQTRSAEEEYLKALRTKQPQHFVQEYQLGGKEFFFEISAYPSKSGLSVFTKDITERKRAEHVLRERVKELQCLYGIAYIVERPGITLDELYQEVVNLLPAGWQYPEITCARITIGDKEFRTDNFRATEWRLSTNISVKGQKEGTIAIYYLEASPELDGGPFLKEERLLLDVIAERLGRITERKRMEAELESSEERLKILFEFAPDAYYLNDLKGNFIDGNKVAEEITGYKRDELIGKSFLKLKLLPLRQMPKAAALLARNALGQATGPDEFILNRKDSNKVPVEIRTFPVKINDKTLVLGIARDITARKQAEQELQEKNEQLDAQNEELQSQTEELITQQQEIIEKTEEVEKANQLKSEFLANMSHELRTPLNVVIGFSELMRDEVPGKINKEQRQCLSDILASSRHLLNLINEVLDLSKIESGKVGLGLQNVALSEVIEPLKSSTTHMLSSRKQNFEVEIEEGLPLVHADGAKVRQVLINLLSNATKVTPDGGKLKIEAVREDNWCRVSVIDNGVGIKKEDQERIFEPFYQLDNPLTKGKGGTGLGLALVRQIIEKHGGQIWVESEYGKGSRFTFTLPLATSD